MAKVEKSLLRKAEIIINGPRAQAYGDPGNCFRDISAMWSLLFQKRITPRQVALAMILLKVIRENHCHGEDNLVDIAGYAALGNQVGDL